MQIAALLFASVIIEGLTEYFFDNGNEAKSQPWLKYVGAVLGVVICVFYGIDILAMFGYTPVLAIPYASALIGPVLTGILIGRGSNFTNDLISRVKSTKPEVVVNNVMTAPATKKAGSK